MWICPVVDSFKLLRLTIELIKPFFVLCQNVTASNALPATHSRILRGVMHSSPPAEMWCVTFPFPQ